MIVLFVSSCNRANQNNGRQLLKESVSPIIEEKEIDNSELSELVLSKDSIEKDPVFTWQKLNINTIDRIDNTNDSIVDAEWKPTIDTSKIVYRVTSSPSFFKELSGYFKESSEIALNEYFANNIVTDNKVEKNRYAIVKYGEQHSLKEYSTKVGYHYGEGAGVRKYISIIGKDSVQSDRIFLMFNETVHFMSKNIEMLEITNDNNNILPENKISYVSDNENLEFEYSSELKTGSYTYDGNGSWHPTTYVNVKFIVKNIDTGMSQVILKRPDSTSGLRKVIICDLNEDSKKDIILEFEDLWSVHRLVYLSRVVCSKVLYDYIGVMEVYREDP